MLLSPTMHRTRYGFIVFVQSESSRRHDRLRMENIDHMRIHITEGFDSAGGKQRGHHRPVVDPITQTQQAEANYPNQAPIKHTQATSWRRHEYGDTAIDFLTL